MIRSLVAHVRGWSFVTKVVVAMTTVFFVMDLLIGKSFSAAFENVLFGATMLAAGEYFVPVVVSALFCYLHDRKGVPAPCGTPVPPTAADWHRVIVSMTMAYTFVAVSLAALRGSFSLGPMLWAGVAFMAPWTGLILLICMIAETAHFFGHYREHRRELLAQEQAREQARRDRETLEKEQAFWRMVRGQNPDPGGIA